MKIYEVAFQLNEPHFLTGFYYSQDIDTACGCALSYADMIAKNYKLKDLQRGFSFLYIREFETEKPYSFFAKLNEIMDCNYSDEQIAFFNDYESGVIPHSDLLTLCISEMTEWQYRFLEGFVSVGLAYMNDNTSSKKLKAVCTKLFKDTLFPCVYFQNDLDTCCHALDLLFKEKPSEIEKVPLNTVADFVEEFEEQLNLGPFVRTIKTGEEVSVWKIYKDSKPSENLKILNF